jgi:hypothetical protein
MHIGHTNLAVMSEFGKFTLSAQELRQDWFRVATFESAEAASKFVQAVKNGMSDEDRAWDQRVPGLPLPKDEEPATASDLAPPIASE